MNEFSGKRIAIIVSGGAAAYQTCDLIRLIRRGGGDVRVAMTESATRLVSPTLFECLSGHPVELDTFGPGIPHIAFTRGGVDILVAAPATANLLAKAAGGIADDLASSIIIARACPFAVAPSMHTDMWKSAATQRNVAQLRADGVAILGPVCDGKGDGRMIEPAEIAGLILKLISPQRESLK